jgi:menaquinone-9 beta-reductase
MDSCDVLIVGGGPAGSSCAWGLRDSGLDVVILDKQTFPRDKVCGGWITPEVLAKLEIDPVDYARQRTLQPITRFRVGCIGGSALETDYGEPVSYGIRRREFDDYLLSRVPGRRILGTPLTSLTRDSGTSNGGWVANAQIRTRVVIGAGGHFCPVARLMEPPAGGANGAKPGADTPVVAQEVEFEMSEQQKANCRVRKDTPELYFCPDMKGYGWAFRKGDFLNVGLGRADTNGLKAHVAAFLEFLKSTGRISFELPALRGHAYLLQGTSARQVIGDGALLVGDAVGLAYPQSGEGILPAIQSGLLAAKIIVGANGQYERQRLEAYRALLAEGPPSVMLSIGRYIPSPVISLLARSLLKMPGFVHGVVLNQWFLHSDSAASSTRL